MSAEITQLKNKTMSGFIWKFGERIIAQLVSLVVSIILARLLTPEDYSVVGIVAIFFAFANVFISGGFNAALIQKKDADIEDYSSVLFISLISAALIYIILFFCAPFIAKAYDQDILIAVFRVMGLTLFINAFKSVLCAYVSRHLQFRKFFLSTIVGTIISAIVGITMAANGFGPWALVAQQMINATIDTIILFFTTRVRFIFKISRNSTKALFKYGWKILVASSVSVLYDEINPLIIGLKYTGADLSYYTKGKSFPQLVNSTVGSTLSAVLFPVMSKMQDDKSAILNYTRRFMQLSSYLIFPMMIGFLAVADKFILVLLTDKWLSATIYIQIFCIVYMFDIIQTGNLQVIRAIGRSDLILILEVTKKVLYAIVILCFVLFSNKPEYLALASIINTVIATIINTAPNRKLIGYRYRLQIVDLFPNFLMAIVMGIAVYAIGLLKINIYLLLIIQVFTGIIVYFLLSLFLKNRNLKYILTSLKNFSRKDKQVKNDSEN
ncbi:MAG: lipopolysaccharide biosynthesis protein [Clostridia bacterium]|nr:lipopolysaccharide biosynthesis protein [Clostridia bacterium]